MQKTTLTAAASATALAALISVLTPASGGAQGTPGCKQASNIEAIVDDSASMTFTDAGSNRVQALKLLIQKQSNAGKTLGAVEFGDTVDTLFKPEAIGPNRAAMLASLAQIQADNGSTDYNAAFDQANADNPNAQARIFLTDGGHNVGDYANGHLGGGRPRTFVIGFGTSTQGDDGARLQKIADDTGGKYFPQTDASNLVSVMNQIDAAINCLGAPVEFDHRFTKPGQVENESLRLARTTRSVQIVASYPAGTKLAVKVVELKGRKVVAAKRRHRKLRKLHVTRTRGDTFLSLQVRGVRPGLTMKLTIKALKLGQPTLSQLLTGKPGVAVKTQVTQSRSR